MQSEKIRRNNSMSVYCGSKFIFVTLAIRKKKQNS